MRIENLTLENFRNFTLRRFDFTEDEVVFWGPNGSGKTNALESIFFLSILRSFRTSTPRELVKIGEGGFSISASLKQGEVREHLSVRQNLSGKRELRLGSGVVRRASDFIREFRAVVFAPEDKYIVSGASGFRRRFFDMLISTLDPGYLASLAMYGRALAQRNRALKEKKLAVAAAFEPVMAESAEVISASRRLYAERLSKTVNELLPEFAADTFGIVYAPEYPTDAVNYLERFQALRSREALKGCTFFGPQLDDFVFYLGGKPARAFASTGQVRLLSLLLRLAEFAMFDSGENSGVVALIDDVTGELDRRNRECFLERISGASQRFFTFAEVPDYLGRAERVGIVE